MLIETWTRGYVFAFSGGEKQLKMCKKMNLGKYLDPKGQNGETRTLHNAELFYLYKPHNYS
jgi:hypothetical protein